MIIGKQAAAPRLSRHCLENMASVDGQERDEYAKSKEVLTHIRWLALCRAERAVRQYVVCGAEHGDDED
jgi:hypothetical protein